MYKTAVMEVPFGTIREVPVILSGREHHGVDSHKTEAIRGYEQPTHNAGAAPYLEGVLKLRGEIVPVVDLRLKLGPAPPACNRCTISHVKNINDVLTGLEVATASDMVALGAEQIRPAPDLGSAFDTRFITGSASTEDRMQIPVDLDKLLAEQKPEALLA